MCPRSRPFPIYPRNCLCDTHCILCLSTALSKLMGWFLPDEDLSHCLLLLHDRSRGKMWSSVVVKGEFEVLHKHNCPNVKHCCDGLAPLQLGAPELIWWPIARRPLCSKTWEKGRALLLVSSLAWSGWLISPKIFQPAWQQIILSYPVCYSVSLPISGLWQVSTESCRLLSHFLKMPSYTEVSVLSCVTSAIAIPNEAQEQNGAGSEAAILQIPEHFIYFSLPLLKCTSN